MQVTLSEIFLNICVTYDKTLLKTICCEFSEHHYSK